MDIPRKDAGRKRLIRRILIGVVVLAAIPAITIGLSRLKPAAPGIDRSTVWIDAVKRGPIVLEVRGLGTLVPEETMLIPATTDGRVQRILIYPGTPVKADSVVMILTSPELETQLLDAEYNLKAAEADFANLKVTLQKAKLDMQSTVAQVGADFNTSKLQADRDQALAKEGLFSEVDAKISAVKAEQLGGRVELEQKRLAINGDAEDGATGGPASESGAASRAVQPEEEPGGPVEGAGRLRRHAATASHAGRGGPEGHGRHAAGEGCPALQVEGRAENRRDAS